MVMRSGVEARALARARWGERPRLADKALDRLDVDAADLAPDQAARLLRIAAGVLDHPPTDQDVTP